MKASHRSGADIKDQMVSNIEWAASNPDYVGVELAKEAAEALAFYQSL